MARLVWTLPDGESTARWATDEGGGSQPGVPVTTRYTVPFDAPGLSDGTGYALFTPTVGGEILDIAVRFPAEFDGTTPKLDVGTGIASNQGLFRQAAGEPPADNPNQQGAGTGLTTYGRGVGYTANLLSSMGYSEYLSTPKITAANPILVWVSQDGLLDGADPGSTQGVAEIVVTVTTPVDVP